VFLPVHLMHQFESFSIEIRLVKVEKIITRWCLYPELVPLELLEHYMALWVGGAANFNHCVVKLAVDYFGASNLVWRFPQVLYESDDHPQGSHNGSRNSFLVERLEENMVSHYEIQGVLCLCTTPTKSSTHKGVNFGIPRCLRVTQLFLYPSYLLVHFTCNSIRA
jgi:hypothetical protein